MKYEKNFFYGTGRRKSAIARVRLYNGKGNFIINNSSLDDYFNSDVLKFVVNQPLSATETIKKFDVVCDVHGGGLSGQAGALRHGIARALMDFDSDSLRAILRKSGFLTRDPRMKERKKYGFKAARKRPQFSKR
ncbi:MAG: 30S ribosomal protein S9 [Oscillospiraceae bacterium]|nr:30S ribosomal protein S9 [Oscillospiraceae bacterium]